LWQLTFGKSSLVENQRRLGPYCFTPTAVCPWVSLMLSTDIVICSESLVAPTLSASSFSLLPTGLAQPWMAYRLVTCAPRLPKTSQLNRNKLGPRALKLMFVRVPFISAFALSPSPNWRTSPAIAFLLVSCCLRMICRYFDS
jgi:hypothetical protein